MNANQRQERREGCRFHPYHWAARFMSLSFALAVLAAAFMPVSARAQSSVPRDETWMPNGPVLAVARTADTVYMGGRFTRVGPHIGSGAPIDASTGQVQNPFPKVNGTVKTCLSDGAGGWYVGGDFTRVGGLERNNIAHILPTGSVDPAWNPNANGPVHALAASGPIIYAGGAFGSIGGREIRGIAALDAGTGNATTWNPDPDGVVDAIAVSGSIVYAGGMFTNIGGETRSSIAALDAATGNATDWNPSPAGRIVFPGFFTPPLVYALAVSGSTVYAAGSFISIGGQPRYCFAALDAATGNATDWNPSANDYVRVLAVSGSTLYVGGDFTKMGEQSRNYIAAFDTATGNLTGWNPDAHSFVLALAVSGPTVYVGGYFGAIGGQPRHCIAALDTITGNATDWDPYAEEAVFAIAAFGSAVYAGGKVISIGGQPRSSIAALDIRTGAATDWNPGAYQSQMATPYVRALAVSGSTVYAGGEFTNIGGQSRSSIAALDAATGNATDWNPESNERVYALAVSGPIVYAGGLFTNIGGQSRNYIAALDAVTGDAFDWNPSAGGGGTYAGVQALAVSGSTIYVGGRFESIGGQPRNYVAALDVTTGNATSWNANVVSPIYTYATIRAIAVYGSTVYVGGENFIGAGGQPRNNLAALDAVTGNATAWNPNANGDIYALAVSGPIVYAGGDFNNIGGQNRNLVAALDATTGNATAWNPIAWDTSSFSYVNAFAVSGSTLHVGGGFTQIGWERRPYFVEFGFPAAARAWPLY